MIFFLNPGPRVPKPIWPGLACSPVRIPVLSHTCPGFYFYFFPLFLVERDPSIFRAPASPPACCQISNQLVRRT